MSLSSETSGNRAESRIVILEVEAAWNPSEPGFTRRKPSISLGQPAKMTTSSRHHLDLR